VNSGSHGNYGRDGNHGRREALSVLPPPSVVAVFTVLTFVPAVTVLPVVA